MHRILTFFVGLRKVYKSSNLSPPTNLMSFEDYAKVMRVIKMKTN